MATGDDAAARGMALVAGSALRNTIHTLINQTRDYIAHFTTWANIAEKPSSFPNVDVAAAGAVTSPGRLARFGETGHLSFPAPESGNHPATKSYVDDTAGSATASPGSLMRRNAAAQVSVGIPTSGNHATPKSYVDEQVDTLLDITGQALDGHLDAVVYSRTLSGSYRNVYVNSDGTLGWVASSRTVKKNIKTWTPDRQAILAMQLVQFQYRVAIDPDGAIQHGLIAEQLDELGLDWLVDYGTSGTPEGVRYDLISLALLSVVQDHETRIHALEQKG